MKIPRKSTFHSLDIFSILFLCFDSTRAKILQQQGNPLYPTILSDIGEEQRMIRIVKVTNAKKRFLPLLLLGDEQESMIDLYLEAGEMFALYDDGKLRTIAVVSKEPKRVFELKNIATEPTHQRQGYGRKMIDYLLAYYHGKGRLLQAGTGAGSSNTIFYEKCGFQAGKTVKDFFTENYDHPIMEDGRQITDMVYYQREL